MVEKQQNVYVVIRVVQTTVELITHDWNKVLQHPFFVHTLIYAGNENSPRLVAEFDSFHLAIFDKQLLEALQPAFQIGDPVQYYISTWDTWHFGEISRIGYKRDTLKYTLDQLEYAVGDTYYSLEHIRKVNVTPVDKDIDAT